MPFMLIWDFVKGLFTGKSLTNNTVFMLLIGGLFAFILVPSMFSKIEHLFGFGAPTVAQLQLQNQKLRQDIKHAAEVNQQLMKAQEQQNQLSLITSDAVTSAQLQKQNLGNYFLSSTTSMNDSLKLIGFNPKTTLKTIPIATKKIMKSAISMTVAEQKKASEVSKIQYTSVWTDYCHVTSSTECKAQGI